MKGSYCLILTLDSEVILTTRGKRFRLTPGTFVYCGSALNSLEARVDRHIRNFRGENTKRFWHIDYLLPFSINLSVVKVATGSSAECQLSHSLASKGLKPVPGFGNSDCKSGCKGHLLHSEVPFQDTAKQVVSSFKELGLSPQLLDIPKPKLS